MSGLNNPGPPNLSQGDHNPPAAQPAAGPSPAPEAAARRHALLRPGIAIPFVLVTLIWGSTWLVIKDQLGPAAPSWSVTWRFMFAWLAMVMLALWRARSLAMSRRAHVLALCIGVMQFSLNFNFVYRAEIDLTSGVVAVLFGLLIIPNAVLGRWVLGTPITRRFMVGSVVAIAGIGLMLVPEAQGVSASGPGGTWPIAMGLGFTLLGILCASAANIMQAIPAAQRENMFTLLAWAMMWGTLANIVIAWSTAGPPTFPARWDYWLGALYLGLFGSVLTFPLYFSLIRKFGAGRAAYVGITVPVVAMVLSTLFEGYRWSAYAVAGALLGLGGMVVALRARSPARKSP